LLAQSCRCACGAFFLGTYAGAKFPGVQAKIPAEDRHAEKSAFAALSGPGDPRICMVQASGREWRSTICERR
jgi:hypothetical protein